MRAFADDLQAMLTIIAAALTIVNMMLTIFIAVWVRRTLRSLSRKVQAVVDFVTSAPGKAVSAVKDGTRKAWEYGNGAAQYVSDKAGAVGDAAVNVGDATVGAVKATSDAARRRVLGS